MLFKILLLDQLLLTFQRTLHVPTSHAYRSAMTLKWTFISLTLKQCLLLPYQHYLIRCCCIPDPLLHQHLFAFQRTLHVPTSLAISPWGFKLNPNPNLNPSEKEYSLARSVQAFYYRFSADDDANSFVIRRSFENVKNFSFTVIST